MKNLKLIKPSYKKVNKEYSKNSLCCKCLHKNTLKAVYLEDRVKTLCMNCGALK